MRAALGFLTVLGGAREPGPRATAWFPVVGAMLGTALAGLAWTAEHWWSPMVVAALVVAADLALTGLLHVDGLADTADGLLAPMGRDRRLEVMRTPDVGAFAVAAVPTVLAVRLAALATGPQHWITLAAVWAASRTVVAVVPAVVPYARADGLAVPFAAGARRSHSLWLIPVTVAAVVSEGGLGLVAVAALVATSAAVVGLARRRIGGYTGDVLGAVVLVGETVALLVLAARP